MYRRLRNELSLITLAAALLSFRRYHQKTAFGLVGLAAALRFVPLGRQFSFAGRHVLITGGSRGLGLALADQLLHEGAKVTLLARDLPELERATFSLRQKHPRGRVTALTCDVTHDADLMSAIREAHHQLGPLDVVINNAGAIATAPFECTDRDDFRAQIDLHLNAVVEMTWQMARYFKARGGGRIVNISSIGGKIAIPHMAAYSASKFALSGFSRSVAAELAEHNITVTTIYPGLMRTGSPIQAVFKGDHQKEFAWFAASDLIPGLAMSPARAARQILKACRNGDVEAVLSLPAKLGVFAYENFPEITGWLAKVAAGLLPHGQSHDRKTGASSQAWFRSRTWAKPLRKIEQRARKRYNQNVKTDADFNLGV